MDDLRFNKIAGAILATGLLVMGIGTIADILYKGHGDAETLAYGNDIYEKYKSGASEGAAETVDLPFPTPEWVAAMDATAGEKVFKKCAACHNVDAGGANGTGPGLYGVVGAVAGQHAGFSYSSAMAESSITWDYESLDAYLESPRNYVKGTAMTFVGLKKPEDRAAVIEYLRVNAPAPMDRPEPAVVIPAEPEIDVVETDAIPPNDLEIVKNPPAVDN